jgi:large subunit ribosomal protein L4
VVEDFTFEAPKTKAMVELLKNLNITDKRTIFIVSEANKNVYLSSRNLSQTRLVKASNLNTYEIMNAHNLVIVESSINEIEQAFGK